MFPLFLSVAVKQGDTNTQPTVPMVSKVESSGVGLIWTGVSLIHFSSLRFILNNYCFFKDINVYPTSFE